MPTPLFAAEPMPTPMPAPACSSNPPAIAPIPTDELAIAMRQARAMAGRWYHLADSYDDLVAEAMLACVETARRYEPGRGAALHTWVWPRMNGQILDVVRRTRRRRERFPLLDANSEDNSSLRRPEPTDGLEPLDARMVLSRAAAELHTTDKLLLQGYYVEGRCITEIARKHTRSRSMLSRRHSALIERLRRHAETAEIC